MLWLNDLKENKFCALDLSQPKTGSGSVLDVIDDFLLDASDFLDSSDKNKSSAITKVTDCKVHVRSSNSRTSEPILSRSTQPNFEYLFGIATRKAPLSRKSIVSVGASDGVVLDNIMLLSDETDSDSSNTDDEDSTESLCTLPCGIQPRWQLGHPWQKIEFKPLSSTSNTIQHRTIIPSTDQTLVSNSPAVVDRLQKIISDLHEPDTSPEATQSSSLGVHSQDLLTNFDSVPKGCSNVHLLTDSLDDILDATTTSKSNAIAGSQVGPRVLSSGLILGPTITSFVANPTISHQSHRDVSILSSGLVLGPSSSSSNARHCQARVSPIGFTQKILDPCAISAVILPSQQTNLHDNFSQTVTNDLCDKRNDAQLVSSDIRNKNVLSSGLILGPRGCHSSTSSSQTTRITTSTVVDLGIDVLSSNEQLGNSSIILKDITVGGSNVLSSGLVLGHLDSSSSSSSSSNQSAQNILVMLDDADVSLIPPLTSCDDNKKQYRPSSRNNDMPAGHSGLVDTAAATNGTSGLDFYAEIEHIVWRMEDDYEHTQQQPDPAFDSDYEIPDQVVNYDDVDSNDDDCLYLSPVHDELLLYDMPCPVEPDLLSQKPDILIPEDTLPVHDGQYSNANFALNISAINDPSILRAPAMIPEQSSSSVMIPEQSSSSVMIPEQSSSSVMIPEQSSSSVMIPEQSSSSVMIPEQSSSSVKPTLPTPSARDVPFISEDPTENIDNDDPKWAILKQLGTDDERYRCVRERWGSLRIPDSNCVLQCQTFRRRRLARETDDGGGPTISIEPPAKRHRTNVSMNDVFYERKKQITDHFDREICKIEERNRGHLSLLAKRHKLEREKTDQDGPRDLGCNRRTTSADINMHNRIYRMILIRQDEERERCKAMGWNSVENLRSERDRAVSKLKNAHDEITNFENYYCGLKNSTNDTTQLKNLTLAQKSETEHMDGLFEEYERFYGHQMDDFERS